MSVANSRRDGTERKTDSLPHVPGEAETGEFQAWEQIDTGRYMPRRIRGSFRGRELGRTFVVQTGPVGPE